MVIKKENGMGKKKLMVSGKTFAERLKVLEAKSGSYDEPCSSGIEEADSEEVERRMLDEIHWMLRELTGRTNQSAKTKRRSR